MKGTLTFFNHDKGYGFIQGEDGKDYFVYKDRLMEDVRDREEVEFELEEGKKGLHAVNVRLLR